ncbi:MAG TPA: TonB-dependent receptor [Candidatus Eremiobacteraceae bacterium]|nr:TonB-dependent receptor [Candidatus Eremiobacteraceae bacterium]
MKFKLFAALATLIVCCLVQSAALADVYGGVRGTVTDDAGNPVAGAHVSLKPSEGSTLTAVSDASGRFFFAQVVFDTYVVTVTANGFETQQSVVTVSSGSVSTVNMRVSKKVLGRVTTHATVGHPASVSVIGSQSILTLPGNTSLGKVTETTPGIVPFSFGEPVSRGYHGVMYEVDGVPLPQSASSQFAEIIDPRNVDRMQVFTGAIPAEFGGERTGAVVNIITKRLGSGSQGGYLSLSGGSYGSSGISFADATGSGPLHVSMSLNDERSNRGLDSPTLDPIHDDTSQGDEFLRAVYAASPRDTYSFDFSNQYSSFQIPIDTNPQDPNDPFFSVPGTDDSQHEYDRFANIVFNRLSADNNGYFEFAPWYRSSRVTYLPDPVRDLAGGAQASTFQDRTGKYYGITTSLFRGGPRSSIKYGLTAISQDFTGQFKLQFIDSNGTLQTFNDNVAKHGSNIGAYVQEQFQASPVIDLNAGVRYDRSTGFVDGNQVSPRVEFNYHPDSRNTIHLYYGRLYAAPALEDVRRDATVINGSGSGGLPVYDLKPETDSIYEGGIAHDFTPLVRGYATLWYRDVANVLDTTQLGSTPLFTLFNSTTGRAQGLEFRVEGNSVRGNSFFFSYGLSQSLASGISGGTFLFSPQQLQGAFGFAPEDHDQTNTVNTAYTWRLANDANRYLTLGTTYGSGFPVQFLNGAGRLPVHWEVNASYGRKAALGHLGYEVEGTNLLDHHYLLKINNGFNTTQYASGRQVTVKLTAPLP